MPHIDFDAKDRVRAAIDIVELAGSYLQLRREGRIYKCLCPWHDDTRPSLQINPDRQSFKCWVCDVGGDVFSFIMKMENVDFSEALKMLAERAGIDIKPAKPAGNATGPGKAASDDKQLLFQAAAWVERTYHEFLLKSPEAEPARKYLAERGITPDSVKRFHLGYAPDRWEWLAAQARGTPFTPSVLATIGALKQKTNGPGYFDFFKGRVLFSIRDLQGRPVALGGRVLPGAASDMAKYFNSPDTPLFSKSSLLYGLDSARESMNKTHTAIVMEGYTDALIAQQCGFLNAVAVLGTALGERHIRLLKRFADRIILVLDGDVAGQKRTNEVLDLFVAEQVDLRILSLPEEFDPCEFLLERGADAFRELLSSASDALEHKIRTVTRGIDLVNDTHGANQALEAMLTTLAKSPRSSSDGASASHLREQQMLARLAREFRVPEEMLWQRLSALRRGARRSNQAAADRNPATNAERIALDAWERELLEIVLVEPESISIVAEALTIEQLSGAATRAVLQKCITLSQEGVTASFERLLLEFDDAELKNLIVSLDETARAKGADDLALRLKDVLANFRRRANDRQQQATVSGLHARFGARDDEEACASLQRVIDQQRSRQGISAPTDG